MPEPPSAHVQRFSFLGIDSIPHDDAEHTVQLHAAGNRFRTLQWIGAFTRLRLLDLRHNLLHSVAGIEACAMTLAEFDLRDNKITSGPHLAVELASLANLVRLDARHNPFCKGFYEASIALSPPTATAMSLRTMPHELGHLPEVESPGEMRLRWRATVICQLPKLTYLDGLEVDLLERRLGARACASQFGDAPSHSNAMLSPYSSAASPADTHGLSCLDSSQRIVSQLMPTPHFRTSPVPRSASAAFTMDAPTPSSCSLHTTARHRDSEESALQRTNCMPSRNTLSGSTRPTTAWGALFEEEPSATKPRVFDITPPGSTRTCDTLMEAAPSITHEGFLDAAFPGSTRGTGALAQDATSSAKGDEIGIALQSSTRATVGELAPAHVNLDEIGIALQSSTRAIVGELAPAHVNLDSCGSCAEDVPVSEAHLLDKDTLHGAAHTKAPKHDWNANEVNLTEASAERETSAKDARPDSDGNLQRDKANFRSPFGCGIDDSRQACSRSAAGSTCGELSPNLGKIIMQRRLVDWRCALVNKKFEDRCFSVAQAHWVHVALTVGIAVWRSAAHSLRSKRRFSVNERLSQGLLPVERITAATVPASSIERFASELDVRERSLESRLLRAQRTLIRLTREGTKIEANTFSFKQEQKAAELEVQALENELTTVRANVQLISDSRLEVGRTCAERSLLGEPCAKPGSRRDKPNHSSQQASFQQRPVSGLQPSGTKQACGAEARLRGRGSQPIADFQGSDTTELVEQDMALPVDNGSSHQKALERQDPSGSPLASDSGSCQLASDLHTGQPSTVLPQRRDAAVMEAGHVSTPTGGHHNLIEDRRSTGFRRMLESSQAKEIQRPQMPTICSRIPLSPSSISARGEETLLNSSSSSAETSSRPFKPSEHEFETVCMHDSVGRTSNSSSSRQGARTDLAATFPACQGDLEHRESHQSCRCANAVNLTSSGAPSSTSLITAPRSRGLRLSQEGLDNPSSNNISFDQQSRDADSQPNVNDEDSTLWQRQMTVPQRRICEPDRREADASTSKELAVDSGMLSSSTSSCAPNASDMESENSNVQACALHFDDASKEANQNPIVSFTSPASQGFSNFHQDDVSLEARTARMAEMRARAIAESRVKAIAEARSEADDSSATDRRRRHSAPDVTSIQVCSRSRVAFGRRLSSTEGAPRVSSENVDEPGTSLRTTPVQSLRQPSEFRDEQLEKAKRARARARAAENAFQDGVGRKSVPRLTHVTRAENASPDVQAEDAAGAAQVRTCEEFRSQAEIGVYAASCSPMTMRDASCPAQHNSQESTPARSSKSNCSTPANFEQSSKSSNYLDSACLEQRSDVEAGGVSRRQVHGQPHEDYENTYSKSEDTIQAYAKQGERTSREAEQANVSREEIAEEVPEQHDFHQIDAETDDIGLKLSRIDDNVSLRGQHLRESELKAPAIGFMEERPPTDEPLPIVSRTQGGQTEGKGHTSRAQRIFESPATKEESACKSAPWASAMRVQSITEEVPIEMKRTPNEEVKRDTDCCAERDRSQPAQKDARNEEPFRRKQASSCAQQNVRSPSGSDRVTTRGHESSKPEPTKAASLDQLSQRRATAHDQMPRAVIDERQETYNKGRTKIAADLHSPAPAKFGRSNLEVTSSSHSRVRNNACRQQSAVTRSTNAAALKLNGVPGYEWMGTRDKLGHEADGLHDAPWYPPGHVSDFFQDISPVEVQKQCQRRNVPSKNVGYQYRGAHLHDSKWGGTQSRSMRMPDDLRRHVGARSIIDIAYDNLGAVVKSRSKRHEVRVQGAFSVPAMEAKSKGAFNPRAPQPLALGAVVIELSPSCKTFHTLQELLSAQPPCAGAGVHHWQYDVLRVMQCHHHLIGDIPSSQVPPCLAFVCGDLAALGNFIRQGLRLNTKAPWGATSDGLLVSKELRPQPIWQEAALCADAPDSCLAAGVWRVVLAICWQDCLGPGHGFMLPSFVVDYSIEALGAQI